MTDGGASLKNYSYARLGGEGRPSRGEEGDDAARVCGCLGCWDGVADTNNTRALLVMTVLFAAIAIGQYFAAAAVGSQVLKADVISMAMDAVSYVGNILGESAGTDVGRLVFSMISVLLLLCFNTLVFVESVGMLRGGSGDDPPSDIEGIVVVTFAGLGLVFDFICLYAYYYYAKKDADAEHEFVTEQTQESTVDDDEERRAERGSVLQKPAINMMSALLHVGADLFRSASTLVLGALMASGALTPDQQDMGDATLAVVIGGCVYAAGAYALYEWCVAFRARRP